MKNRFLKDTSMVIGISILFFVSVGLLIASIVMSTIDISGYWPFLAISIMIFIVMLAMVIHKDTFSQIVFSKEGIDIYWFKKHLKTIRWIDVTEFKVVFRKAPVLAICERETQNIVDLTKKMYKAIIHYCPSERLLQQLETNPYFEWFRK